MRSRYDRNYSMAGVQFASMMVGLCMFVALGGAVLLNEHWRDQIWLERIGMLFAIFGVGVGGTFWYCRLFFRILMGLED